MDACYLVYVAFRSDTALDTRSRGHDAKMIEQLLLLGADGAHYWQKLAARAFCQINASETLYALPCLDGH